jgi:predicted metal-dependent phosphoesterase TrpH
MWSGDCTTTPDEIVEAVAGAAIDVLCITDHGTTNGAQELAERLPCEVVVGEELRTHGGEIIGLFLSERLPAGLPTLEAARRIRAQGGLVYVPHPFDPTRYCMRESELVALAEAGLVDVLEVFNAKTSLGHLNERAAAFAASYGIPGAAGSDAHVPEAFGAAYVEMPAFDGPGELLGALPAGRLSGHHFDQARRWRPRIVPSTKAT